MIKFIYTFCILRNQFTFQLFIILASNVPLGVQIPRPLGQKEQARPCRVACWGYLALKQLFYLWGSVCIRKNVLYLNSYYTGKEMEINGNFLVFVWIRRKSVWMFTKRNPYM